MHLRHALASGLVAILGVWCGCGGSTSPTAPTALSVTGGNLQNGCPLEPLPESLEVTLTESDGTPRAGAAVTWEVTGGSAALSSTVSRTDQAGRSRVQLTLGLGLSAVVVRATAGAVPAAIFSATGRVVPTGLGQTTASALNASSCTFVGGGPFDAYALTLPTSQDFTLSLSSDSFNAALELVDEHFTLGGGFNFDSAPGTGVTNSFLKMIAAAGAYGIAAAAQDFGATGPYTFTIAAVPVHADSCLDDVWVTLGVVTRQELTATDCVDSTGPYYFDHFQLILVTGQSVTITESASAFDAELFVHSSSGRVLSDDNSGGGTNARLSYTNTSNQAEVLHILPSTVAAGASGAYTLTIDPPTVTGSARPSTALFATPWASRHFAGALRSR